MVKISKTRIGIMSFAVIIFLLSGAVYAQMAPDEEINNVLTAAESLFKAMKDKKYPLIWTMITSKTKKKIIHTTYDELKKAGRRIEKDKIEEDFRTGNAVARAYWDEYLLIFDPQLVLDHSKWTIGRIGPDKSEINVHFKKSKFPAVLKLFKENDVWKVGLDETFGARSLLSFF